MRNEQEKRFEIYSAAKHKTSNNKNIVNERDERERARKEEIQKEAIHQTIYERVLRWSR